MKHLIIAILVLTLSSCSTVGTYGTHPVEQGIADFILNESGSAIRNGGVYPELGRRAGGTGFSIMQSEYWRIRQEQIIQQRGNRPFGW